AGGRSTRSTTRPLHPRRSAGVALRALCCAAVVLVFAAPAAGAKSYTLPEASVDVTVQPDGAVDVVENITYDFSGTFEGAWRDIPSRFGETVDQRSVRVFEN